MTPRQPPPDLPDPGEPVLPDDQSAAVGRRVRELALTVETPASRRARIDGQRAAAQRRRRPRLTVPALAAGGLAAVVAAVLVLAGVGGGGSTVPSVDDAVALALARPTAAAPAIDPANTTLIRAQVGGVPFPNYTYSWPRWRTAGVREDRIAGRSATTVVYRGPRGDVGYTIVDGKPLPEPAGARHVTAAGVRLAVLRRGDVTVVTWRRGGHTCVLAGRGEGVERQLVRFATWA
jgi:hypothetical protein